MSWDPLVLRLEVLVEFQLLDVPGDLEVEAYLADLRHLRRSTTAEANREARRVRKLIGAPRGDADRARDARHYERNRERILQKKRLARARARARGGVPADVRYHWLNRDRILRRKRDRRAELARPESTEEGERP